MNTTKLDAPLRAAIQDQGGSSTCKFDVFVHTSAPPRQQSEEASCLRTLGIDSVNGRRAVFSASLSLEQIERVSEIPWIKILCLSQTRRPMDETAGP